MKLLNAILFPSYRSRVLNLLLLHPEKKYHIRDIARLTNTVPGTLHRELTKLAIAEILKKEVSGKQSYFQANTDLSIFQDLVNILQKTSGVADVIANALSPIREKVEAALLFGSIAKGTESIGSDIDLLIIGKVNFAEVVTLLYPAQEITGREINPKVYSRKEWKELQKNKNLFAKEIIKNPKIFIIGTINDLR